MAGQGSKIPRLYRLAGRRLRDTSWQTLVVVALSLGVVLTAVAGAVGISQFLVVRAQTQTAADAGALAATTTAPKGMAFISAAPTYNQAKALGPGEKWQLSFGVVVHEGTSPPDVCAGWADGFRKRPRLAGC